jgi:hypothetical protein
MVKKLSLTEYSAKIPKLGKSDYYVIVLIFRGEETKKFPKLKRHSILKRYWSKDFLDAVSEAMAVKECANLTVDGKPLPRQNVKVMYYLNPVDFLKLSYLVSTTFIQEKMNTVLASLRKGDLRGAESVLLRGDVFSLAFSNMAKAVKKHVIMVDVDTKDMEFLSLLEGVPVRFVIETQHGYHLHVYIEDVKDNETLKKLYSINEAFSRKDSFKRLFGEKLLVKWKESLIEVKGTNPLEYVPTDDYPVYELESRDVREFVEFRS